MTVDRSHLRTLQVLQSIRKSGKTQADGKVPVIQPPKPIPWSSKEYPHRLLVSMADAWLKPQLSKYRKPSFVAAVTGAGKSILQLDIQALRKYSVIACCNNVANLVVRGGGHPYMIIVQIDSVCAPVLDVYTLQNCKLLITSNNNASFYSKFCDDIIVFPDSSPIRPLGSSAVCAWVLRLINACAIDIYGCDSAIGNYYRGFADGDAADSLTREMYKHHPGNLVALSQSIPCRWLFPDTDSVFKPASLTIPPGDISLGTELFGFAPLKSSAG